VAGGVVGDNCCQLIHADDVAQEEVAEDKREAKKDGVLEGFDGDFAGRPGRLREGALLAGIAFDFVFDAAEDHFHEDGLRAEPAAPEAAVGGGENHDAREVEQKRDGDQGHVLRPEDVAKHGKAARDDVDHEERIAVDLHKRPDKQRGEDGPA